MGIKFQAEINVIGFNPYVEVPPEVSRELGGKPKIRVKGFLNGHPIKATMMPVGGGLHRMYINTIMRRQSRLNPGDTVMLDLEADHESREHRMPAMLADALENDAAAKEGWNNLLPSRRHEIMAYMNYLKKSVSVERNTRKVMDYLKKKS